jgi:hypothetical protein
MKPHLLKALCATCFVLTITSSTLAFCQTIATVYVSHISSNAAGAPNVVSAWAADSTGRLSAISESPFRADAVNMAVNGKYLFANSVDGTSVNTFRMSSSGALSKVDTIKAINYSPSACQQPTDVTLDHTGSTLYVFSAFYGTHTDCPTDPVFQSFQINKTSGALTFLGNTKSDYLYSLPLRLASGNNYAYEASGETIFGFKRETNGDLTYYDTTTHFPTPPAGQYYNPFYATADPKNNLAVILQRIDSTTAVNYPANVAVYTISSTGTLTTSSTYSNMPKLSIGIPYYSAMSPSGKLLAISGSSGLLVVHWNGSSPVTLYTHLLATGPIGNLYWDNNDHLYAVGSGKLYVFTVTPIGYSQAPGSPHLVFGAAGLTVQPK